MPYLSWLGQEAALSPAALTVRVQTLPINDNGRGGQLLYDAFFPRKDVDSIDLQTISDLDYRPVADRREWNARGRAIPLVTPKTATLQLVPVESYYTVDEFEMQKLSETVRGNQTLLREMIGASIPARTVNLAIANLRRLEIDAFTAWANGTIVARNPQTATTQTFSFGFDAARYTTAGTAWNVVANAYNEFLVWLRTAIDLVGPISGVMLRQATLNEIQADAPNPFSNIAGIQVTRSQLVQRIQDDLGSAFQFVLNENQEDVFTTAGTIPTRTKIWPTGKIAAIPAGATVGQTAFAPVVRAYEVANAAPDAKIDVRGMTAYVEVSNGGREAKVEVQVNALALPIESRVAVINVGV